MTILQSLILGIIQGITEFLPISSSAHLVLFPYLLGWQLDEKYVFSFNVLVQIGTLAAVIAYFREDLWIIAVAMVRGIIKRQPFQDVPARTGYLILLATIPAGVVGLLAKDLIESAFSSPRATSLFLMGTAILLISSEYIGKRNRDLESITYQDAIWIGLFQAISVFPGISRSGSTITGGMTRHLDRKTSGQFALIMMIPIMLAAGLLETSNLLKIEKVDEFLPFLIIGFCTATVSGFITIRWLLKFISTHSLIPFAVYCFILGAGSLTLTLTQQRIPVLSLISPQRNEVVVISYEPDMAWMLPIMNGCLSEDANPPFFFQQHPWRANILSDSDMALVYGERSPMGKYTFIIGEEEVNPVVNRAIPLRSMNPQLVQDIFLGRITQWGDAYQSCPICFYDHPSVQLEEINLYTLPSTSPFSQFFYRNFLEAPIPTGNLIIAPTSQAMREMIINDPSSIGYIPNSWFDESVMRMPEISDTDNIGSIPIIASSLQEPQEPIQKWLICLQTSLLKH